MHPADSLQLKGDFVNHANQENLFLTEDMTQYCNIPSYFLVITFFQDKHYRVTFVIMGRKQKLGTSHAKSYPALASY